MASNAQIEHGGEDSLLTSAVLSRYYYFMTTYFTNIC
jgi:hypothetical protein